MHGLQPFMNIQKNEIHFLTLCIRENPSTGIMANSEDPDEMQHNAAFHQGLHCLRRLKQPSRTEIHYNLEKSTRNPFKSTISSPILIVSLSMGKSIRIQRVK